MDLSIVMAYKSDGGLRDRHFRWTMERYRTMMPGVEIVVSEDKRTKTKDWEGFCKSKYINRGVKRAHGKFVLITDIDIILPKESIYGAMDMADRLDACVVPYSTLCKLNHGTSSVVLSKRPAASLPVVALEKQKRVSLENGRPQGIAVISRKNFMRIGGYDERFVGWGSEDSAFQSAAMTLCTGGLVIYDGIAMHLWHKIMKNRHKLRDERIGDVVEAYKNARFDRGKMLEIIRHRYDERSSV